MNQDLMNAVLAMVERLIDTFRYERFAYLACTVVGFGILAYSVITAITLGTLKPDQLGAVFGSTGLVTLSSAGVLYMFKRAFSLVEDVVRAQLGMPGRPAAEAKPQSPATEDENA